MPEESASHHCRVTHDELREDTAPPKVIAQTCPFACGKILSISNILQRLVAIVLTATEKIANKHPSQTENYRADCLANQAAWVLLFESKQYSACSTSHYGADWLANPAAWVLLFESKQYSACSTSHYSTS